ncbi:cytochrome B [Mucilaginibacter glaciei]|uniref:Cytochrome B n=1 Tax=Mucilaginibacter glaciei TaxID=2772109 RepID=A0A926S2X4_9SPHI|nr:cytochrome B [Mucilaginibacter glaciei]MBD1393624.1 cytochrome B [Mucilaginibacter glaciei]
MNAYSFFKYFHSGFRYFVIIVVLLAIISAFAGWFGKKQYTEANRKTNLIAMILFHTQLLIGLVLYFLSPFVVFAKTTMKDPMARYWTVEHITMMIFAIVLVTIGHAKSKRITLPVGKHRTIAIFYSLAFLVVVVAIIQSHRPFFGITQ